MFLKKIILLFSAFLYVGQIFAQTPKTFSSSEIFSQIQKLNVVGSVLYIAAHPDDENTRLLGYLANEKKYRTGYLSLTRGDGGQNLIGDEQGVDLGLIRTQELLAARNVDGAKQFFTSAYDFGYSKNQEEALSIWGHDKILSDVVFIIRTFKPDVIICRFPTTGEGGHGHHTASAILAEEAFDAAADSTKFPEHFLSGVSTWKAKRLLWNTFNFGSTNTQKEDQFKLDVGGFNALLGKSYGEMAALSRSQHKSQGFGVPAQRGKSIEYFKTIKGEPFKNDLFEGINTQWSRFENEKIQLVKDLFELDGKDSEALFDNAYFQQKIDSLIQNYNLEHPENSTKLLTELFNGMLKCYPKGNSLLTSYKFFKMNEILNLIESCSGLYMEVIATQPKIVAGDTTKLTYSFINRSGIPIQRIRTFTNGKDLFLDEKQTNQTINLKDSFLVENNQMLSQPYWLKNKMNKGSYALSSLFELQNPEDKGMFNTFDINLSGTPFFFEKPIMYKYTDPIKGEIYQPAVVIPGLYIKPEKSLLIKSNNGKTFVNITLIANRNIVIDSLKANNRNLLFGTKLSLVKDEKKVIKVEISDASTQFVAYEGAQSFETYAREIKYDHIPNIIYFKPAVVECKSIDYKIAGKKIGYIEGAGDKVAEALTQMGYVVTILKKEDIVSNKLKDFDAIVTGVRAYNTNEWMNEVYEVLMNYVKEGGLMLVQYNTSNQIGPIKAKIAPFPFTVSRNRITDENATVNILNPELKIFNYPNKITASDFEGWVQERSIYHVTDADSNYIKPLSMKDPGEKENDGSLAVANYGKGKFIYTGLVFFRELPAGVPGAYRFFANLLAK
jgi:LmbE family N-acetylglucosaminyl deacetylase